MLRPKQFFQAIDRGLLDDVGPASDVVEVVFWGADRGEETIRTGKYEMNFARSMSLADAAASDAILAYEVDGAPLPAEQLFAFEDHVYAWRKDDDAT